MCKVVVAYEQDAGFWTGRLVDRLALHFGERAIEVLHPRWDAHPAELLGSLDGCTGLLTVSSSLGEGAAAHAPSNVHLPLSLAIRRGLPVLAVELHDERSGDRPERSAAAPGDTGVDRFELDVGDLERETDRLIVSVEHRLGDGARIFPTIHLGPTTVPAFVGVTAKVPFTAEGAGAPQRLSTWSEFEAQYGGFVSGAMLPYAVHGWFANGGRECYVVPIQPRPEPDGGISRRPTAADYIGEVRPPTGLRGAGAVEDVTTLVLPDLVTVAASVDGSLDLDAWNLVQREAIQLAEGRGQMALLDAPPGLSAHGIERWRVELAMFDSAHACVYYPWIKVADPLTGRSIEVPPSGHLAGLWAATDRDRGVWRAPANRRLEWVDDVARLTSPVERFILAAVGINPIRSFGRGDVRPWGSRTLSTDGALVDLEAARLLQAIERACAAGLAWSRSEPNDAAMRSVARRRVEGFLAQLWHAGGLVGDVQRDAFVVRCDDEDDASSLESPLRVVVGVAVTEPGVFAWLGVGGSGVVVG